MTTQEAIDTLITDRTQDDVEQAIAICAKGWDGMTQAERKACRRGLKGAYNHTDMNRVVRMVEYINDVPMARSKRESVYVPTIIPHAEYTGTAWKQWSDKVWRDSDYATPALWAAYLANIERIWEAARRFFAVVPEQYDPNGIGYIPLDAPLTARDLFTVTESAGLMELRVSAVCPPEITASGLFWTVTEAADGWTAALDYTNCPYEDIHAALKTLSIKCGADATIDGSFTLSAVLRHDYEATAGTCAVRWSSWKFWPRVGQGWFTLNFDADAKE